MTKRQIILYAVAALFAISGITALPAGNITGGIGCIVIAAACAFFGKKSGTKQRKTETATAQTLDSGSRTEETIALKIAESPKTTAAQGGSRIIETIRTKVVGVTFDNEDGENRQDILSTMTGDEEIEIEKTAYNGKPAAYVKWGDKVLGYLSAELAGDLARKYPKARYAAEILEISGGGYIRSVAI